MPGPVRTVYTELALKVQGFQAGIATARQSVKGFTGELDNMAKVHRERFDGITNHTAIAGAGMLAVVGFMAKASMEFDKQMSEVAATMANDMPDGLNKLREAALQAGKDTQFSATEAAKAEAELAKAGISTADIYGGALSGSLALAAAGTVDLAEAATIAAQAMNIYGLKGTTVGHIADVLAAGANKSAADVHQLGEALRMGGLASANAGMSLEDTVGVLAAFHDRALVGSDAGTSLKTMLMMLQAPTEKSASLMQSLGIKVYDASGTFVGAAKLAGILQEKLGGLTQEERNAALATIFGADATRAATVLYTQGAAGISKYIEAVDDQGAAAEAARVKTDNLAGDIERLTGSLETLFITSSSGTNGGLRILAQALESIVSTVADMPPVLTSTLTVLVGIGGAGLLAAAGLMKARSTAADTLEALREMGPTGEKAAAGLSKVGSVATKATLWAVAAFAAYEGIRAYVSFIDSATAPTVRNIDEMSKSLKEFGRSGQVIGELSTAFGADMKDLQAQMKAVADEEARANAVRLKSGRSMFEELGAWQVQSGERAAGLSQDLEKASRQAMENIGSLDKALVELVRAGGVTQAKLAFDQLAARWVSAGGNLDDLKAKLPEYAKAADGAALANTGLARGFASADGQAMILAGTLNEAVEAGQTLTEVWNSLNGAVLNSDKAMLDANKAIEAIGKSFKENGRAISGNSTAALENRIKIEEAAQAAAKAAQATFEKSSATKGETAALRDASGVYDTLIGKLHDELRATGLSEAKVRELIAAYTSMPAAVATQVSAPGLNRALGDVHDLRDGLNKLPNKTSVGVVIKFASDWSNYRAGERANRWGGLYEKAATGTLREANIYSAVNPGRYMIAEPETGGEAFIPKYGDRGRNMSILSHAAAWNDASVVPNRTWRSGSGGTTTVIHEHHHTLTLNGTSVLSGLREVIDLKGGDPVKVLGSRR